jgi:ABC-type transport system involved in multi-copper enzyme maturation permease subunit
MTPPRDGARAPIPAWQWLAAGGIAALAGILLVAGSPVVRAATLGGLAMAGGYVIGLFAIRRLLMIPTGVAGVARAVVDEAIGMRSTLGLLFLALACVPVLPLLLDPSERLSYRLQFLITWNLGGASLILAMLTAFLACASVSGDIASGRIQMTLAKPLARLEYLVGKWLGIAMYNLLLVVLVGIGSYTLVMMLANEPALDDADRDAIVGEVLVARREFQPTPENPDAYEAAIAVAIEQFAADDPKEFARQEGAVRRRLRKEYDWQWHTVTPDMVSTFVFRDLGTKDKENARVQLEMKPRVLNVDIDLSDVRFAMWLNDRPWPLKDGEPVVQQLPSYAKHVFELPTAVVSESDDLQLRMANRNHVPAGETRATAITLPPGDGLRVFVRTGGFETNFLLCLAIMWFKLTLVAAVGVAAGAMFDFSSAILATLVIYAAALGSDFFRDSLGIYNVAADTVVEGVAERMAYTAKYMAEGQGYATFRMLMGFVTDCVLGILPSFSSDAAISSLATGIEIPPSVVAWRLFLFCLVYPAAFGLLGWIVLDRRDLVRSGT